MLGGGGLTVDPKTPDAREILNPAHSWSTAKRCIPETCVADKHDWAALAGLDEPAYW